MTNRRKGGLLLEAVNQLYVVQGLLARVGLGHSPTFYRLTRARRTLQTRIKRMENQLSNG